MLAGPGTAVRTVGETIAADASAEPPKTLHMLLVGSPNPEYALRKTQRLTNN